MVEKEVEACSTLSWEDAVDQALQQAAEGVKIIKSVTIGELSTRLTTEEQTEYRVNLKVVTSD